MLVRRGILGGRAGQGMVADGRGRLWGRQADGRWRKGVVGVEGVRGGRDKIVLRGGRVGRGPHDDKAGAAPSSTTGLVQSFIVQQLAGRSEVG